MDDNTPVEHNIKALMPRLKRYIDITKQTPAGTWSDPYHFQQEGVLPLVARVTRTSHAWTSYPKYTHTALEMSASDVFTSSSNTYYTQAIVNTLSDAMDHIEDHLGRVKKIYGGVSQVNGAAFAASVNNVMDEIHFLPAMTDKTKTTKTIAFIRGPFVQALKKAKPDDFLSFTEVVSFLQDENWGFNCLRAWNEPPKAVKQWWRNRHLKTNLLWRLDDVRIMALLHLNDPRVTPEDLAVIEDAIKRDEKVVEVVVEEEVVKEEDLAVLEAIDLTMDAD